MNNVIRKKEIICIYRRIGADKKLSAMINGSKDIKLIVSKDISTVKSKLKKYLSK